MVDEDAQERFVWPPKAPASEADLAERATTRAPSPSNPADQSTPGHRNRGPAATASSVRGGAPAFLELKHGSSWWRAIEDTWLGIVTPSFADRAADATWSPDAPSEYCGKCGHPIEPQVSTENGSTTFSCTNCKGTRPRYSRVVRLGAYDGLLRDAIHEVKFTAWRRLGTELGHLLGRQLAAALDAARLPCDLVVLVPMPTTTRRRLARGIDHSTVLARGVRDVLDAPIVHAVQREHRPSQTNVPLSQRRDNVARSMRLKPGVDLFARLVIIIDDVVTTGSTMGECARAIRDGTRGETTQPLDVWAGVLSVAADRPRHRPATNPLHHTIGSTSGS